MAIAADSFVEPFRAFTVFRTDLTHRSNLDISSSPETNIMEPEWTKKIPNETICQYYQVLFYFTVVVVSIALLADLYVMSTQPRTGFIILLRSLPMLIVSLVSSLFLYILCSRTLLK